MDPDQEQSDCGPLCLPLLTLVIYAADNIIR